LYGRMINHGYKCRYFGWRSFRFSSIFKPETFQP
jgi:hypothetical protein